MMFDLSSPKIHKKLYVFPDPDGEGKRADVCISLGRKMFFYDETGKAVQPCPRWLGEPVKGVYANEDDAEPILLEDFVHKLFDGRSIRDYWYQVNKRSPPEAGELPVQRVFNKKVNWMSSREASIHPHPPDNVQVRVNYEASMAAWKQRGKVVKVPLLAPFFGEYECEALFVEFDKDGADTLSCEPMWVSTALKMLPGLDIKPDDHPPTEAEQAGSVMADPKANKAKRAAAAASNGHADSVPAAAAAAAAAPAAAGAAAGGRATRALVAPKVATPQVLAGKRGRPTKAGTDAKTATPSKATPSKAPAAAAARPTRINKGKDASPAPAAAAAAEEAVTENGVAAEEEEADGAPAAKKPKGRLTKASILQQAGAAPAASPAAAPQANNAAAASEDETRLTGAARAPAPSANNTTKSHHTASAGPSASAAERAHAALHAVLNQHIMSLSNDDVVAGAAAFNEQMAMRFRILEKRAGEKQKQ